MREEAPTTVDNSPATTGGRQPLVVVFGTFPPPVTGMTLCTERTSDFLDGSCQVRRLNLSDNSAKISWPFRIRKFFRMTAALVHMLLSPSLRGARLYMPLNAGFAMYYNLAAAAIARLRGWPAAVHHHAYSYLNKRDWRVAVLDRFLGPKGLHLLLCPQMRQRLSDVYSPRAACELLPSTILLTQHANGEQPSCEIPGGSEATTVRRLGHISNLSVSKGTLIAIHTFAKLRDEGQEVELIVAGPVMEPAVEREIALAEQKFPGSFHFRGPVYGEAKTAFFKDIDVLLFPSTYPLEAQPIVLSEAFAHGKPALAYSISCIPGLLGTSEWHVPRDGDFIKFAGTIIKRWRENPAAYAAAQEYARRRVLSLKEDAEQALARFAGWLQGDSKMST